MPISKTWTATIDVAAKIAAIVTPVLVALGGWYVSSIASENTLALDRFEKSSPLLTSISTATVDKRRDALFSLIETHRPDLLRRAIAYLDNDMEYQHTKKLEEIGHIANADAKREASYAEFIRFNTEQNDLFQPLVLGALAANDTDEAEALIDAAPSILKLYIPDQPAQYLGQSGVVLDTILDFAVDHSSAALVHYILIKGCKPSSLTLQKAVRRGDIHVLTMVAEAAPRTFPYAFPLWQTVARTGTVEDIDLLRNLGFAKDTSTAIGQQPIVTEAASTYDAPKVLALANAGFPISEIDEGQKSDLMRIVAKRYSDDAAQLYTDPPDEQKVADTMFAICSEYRMRGITAEDIGQRERMFTPHVTADDRTDIFEALVSVKARAALRCASEFYAFDKFSDDEKAEIFQTALIHDGSAEMLIDDFGFPLGLRDSDGRTLLMMAAKSGNAPVTKRLSTALDIAGLDKAGKGIYAAFLDSPSLDPIGDTSIGFSTRMKKLNALLDLAQSRLGINHRDGRGYTPLMIAIHDGHIDKIRAVVARKPDLNVLALDGQSALSLSVDRPEIYVQLYARGARRAGRIDDCEGAQKLKQWLDANAYQWQPLGQHDWNPKAVVEQSSKSCPA